MDNIGSDWIINKPLNLASNQEIVFADGVVIQAKEDCFHGKNDSLFTGKNLTNLTMQGEGNAVLRMRKKDYQDSTKYSRAEWRMGISLIDCKNVIIRNFTVTQTGGDGLYLGAGTDGYCKNVLVEDMNFDDNHRLGLAVISAEDLMIRRCKFNNTLGTGPDGGIDFEPNHPGQRLVNCVVEDSELAGNTKGGGIDIYTVKLNADSLPLSITFNRCNIKGNAAGMSSTIWRKPDHSVKGTVTFNDCHSDHNRISLRNATVDSAQYLFKNCIFDYSPVAGKTGWDNSPFTLVTDVNVDDAVIGGIAFDKSIAIVGEGVQPISGPSQGVLTFSNQITGTLSVKQNGKMTLFDLASYIKEQRKHWDVINALKPATVDLEALHAPDQDAIREKNDQFYLQGSFTFLQYAKQDEQITVKARTRKVYDRVTEVELQDPSGKMLQTVTLPLDGKVVPITFTAEQTGFYRVVRKSTFSQLVDVSSSQRGNGLLADNKIVFLKPQGRMYFQVPAGVRSFNLGITTDSTADVALLEPSGKEVERHNGVKNMQLFSGTRTNAFKSEIWSINVSKAIWLVTVHMYAPLVPIVSTNPGTMLMVD